VCLPPGFSGLVGFTASASPSSFTLEPGGKQTIQITFTRTSAALNAYTGGQITWTGSKGHRVRIPAVIRPVALSAPVQVSGSGEAISYGVTFGYSGAFSAAARGLVPAVTQTGTVSDDPTDTFVPGGPGTTAFTVSIPAGATYARFSLFDDAITAGGNDVDLYVYNGATQVGSSGGGTSAEEVNLINPAAGDYTVYVHGWGVTTGTADFTLFSWALGSTAAGNMTVTAPAAAVQGPGAISLSFSGLTAGRYLGSVAYSGIAGLPNPTIVYVNQP
ncbi:MAG: pre-peptidase C-terminal domain-containing protein, partial [Chloroflexota bacterium]